MPFPIHVERQLRQQIHLINFEEKKKVLQVVLAAPDDYQEIHGDDLPLFWQESTQIVLFMAVLDELHMKSCFDMTPGSGAFMEACLSLG